MAAQDPVSEQPVGGAVPSRSRLILASASPRRAALLREWHYDFIVVPAGIDEESCPAGMPPIEQARWLSFRKAQHVAQTHPADVVLGADTVVAFGDQSLGKPADAEDARRMLALLSGTTHIVITGVTVICRETGFTDSAAVMSAVRMRALSPQEIDAYVASGRWQGKAGAYGIQDDDPFVVRVSGSHTNIVGLPMETVCRMLEKAGILPQRPVAIADGGAPQPGEKQSADLPEAGS